jgi:hypothetical protein
MRQGQGEHVDGFSLLMKNHPHEFTYHGALATTSSESF